MTTRPLCSLILLTLACHRAPPAAPPGNTPGDHAEAAPLLRSFWDDRRHGGGGQRCAAADYQRMDAHAGEPPVARAEAWAALTDTCWLDWQGASDGVDAAGLVAYVGFGTALFEAGFPHDCEALLTAVTTPYPGGLQDVEVPEDLAELAAAALALGERCGAAAEAQLAAFAPPTCPSDDACFALVEGEALTALRREDEASFTRIVDALLAEYATPPEIICESIAESVVAVL